MPTRLRHWTKSRYPKTLIDMHFKVTSTVKEDARLGGSKEVVVTTDSPDQELATRFTPGESTRCF